uniref:Glutathione peroxidase 3 n=1 Tax=Meleagris gallopavo TaxID=9103 RepID=A0A803YGS3_MELGA
MGGWQASSWGRILCEISTSNTITLMLHPLGMSFHVKCYDSVRGTIYDYGALTIDGDEYIPFRKYAGKMVLFVNVATY